MENNEILNSLAQVPELVDSTNKLITLCNKWFPLLSEATQKRMQAEIPDSERMKLRQDLVENVAKTRCAPPDMSAVSDSFAEKLVEGVKETAYTETRKAIDDAMSTEKVEHVHVHTTSFDLVQYAEKKVKGWIAGFAILTAIFLAVLVGCVCFHVNSMEHLGAEYVDVVLSKYITNEEKALFEKDCYSISSIPAEYYGKPKLLKDMLKRNQEILHQRAVEAKAKKGKYSTKVPLRR